MLRNSNFSDKFERDAAVWIRERGCRVTRARLMAIGVQIMFDELALMPQAGLELPVSDRPKIALIAAALLQSRATAEPLANGLSASRSVNGR